MTITLTPQPHQEDYLSQLGNAELTPPSAINGAHNKNQPLALPFWNKGVISIDGKFVEVPENRFPLGPVIADPRQGTRAIGSTITGLTHLGDIILKEEATVSHSRFIESHIYSSEAHVEDYQHCLFHGAQLKGPFRMDECMLVSPVIDESPDVELIQDTVILHGTISVDFTTAVNNFILKTNFLNIGMARGVWGSCVLQSVVFSNCVLTDMLFKGCTLHGVTFRNCILNRCAFEQGVLSQVKFIECQLYDSTFQGDLKGLDLSGVNGLHRVQLPGGVVLGTGDPPTEIRSSGVQTK